MITIIESHNAVENQSLLDKMFLLRARVFRDKLGWDVQVVDGKERDRYDDENPVYIIYSDDEGREVKGSLRLLPTTGPTVLADFFSDTAPELVNFISPSIWECTRLCLDDQILSKEDTYIASAVLIAALGEFCLKSGIESILGNFDDTMLRLYRRIGCDVDVIGHTERYGGMIHLGIFPISEKILSRVNRLINLRKNFN